MKMREDLAQEARNHSPRFQRQGRLAPFPGAPPGAQVRCSCDRCGSHLLAARRPDGHLDGSCPVCLSRQVTSVGPHQAG